MTLLEFAVVDCLVEKGGKFLLIQEGRDGRGAAVHGRNGRNLDELSVAAHQRLPAAWRITAGMGVEPPRVIFRFFSGQAMLYLA